MVSLTDYIAGKKPKAFKPVPHYVPEGDSLFFYFKDVESYAERVDELLTVFRSVESKELVGCQIKSIRCVLKKLGSFGVHIEDGKIHLALLFLACLGCNSGTPQEKALRASMDQAESFLERKDMRAGTLRHDPELKPSTLLAYVLSEGTINLPEHVPGAV